jgi:acyl dehydratase
MPLEHIRLGDPVSAPSVTITETHVVNWTALTGDWFPLHNDAEYAARTTFGQRVAHGPLILGMSIGMATQGEMGRLPILAWLGLENVRAMGPVFIGDTVSVTGAVADFRLTSRGDKAIVRLHLTVRNQRSETVMTYDNLLCVPASAVATAGDVLTREGGAHVHEFGDGSAE